MTPAPATRTASNSRDATAAVAINCRMHTHDQYKQRHCCSRLRSGWLASATAPLSTVEPQRVRTFPTYGQNYIARYDIQLLLGTYLANPQTQDISVAFG